ncbi:MAG: alpha/beta fold hydrolase, partial [Hyphomonadaceae bacterium]|nr:alpha/beta fold hydrolase [Hyphomonadaceae bacterium]
VMQVEKSGMGDSQGAPCAGVDFEAEVRAYDAAFAALRADRRVNADQVFVFGHSIGSISAPEVGHRHGAAGVIIAQGLGRTWIEYELINTRRQLEMSGADAATIDGLMIWKARCLGRVLLAQEPVEQVFAQTPECQSVTVLPASQAYMAQLTAINIAELWTNLASPALIIYGDSDFVTDLADHERLAALVNAAHPGNATLTVIEDLDHFLARTESQMSSFAALASGQAGSYDHRLSETIGDWICARATCAS